MEIQVLASGSAGNAYIVGDGATQLLLDCGIPWKEIQQKTDFAMPDACFVSHSHGDHAKSCSDVTWRGIPCYMSSETQEEIGTLQSPLFITLEHRKMVKVGTFQIVPLDLEHDVHCMGFYIYSTRTKESLFFATDTCVLPYKFQGLDYIMVEANYDIDILNDRIMQGYIDPAMKNRLVKSHMEIGQTILWLRKQDLTKTKRIYLLHLSHGSSNAAEFKSRVEEVTGIPTTIA